MIQAIAKRSRARAERKRARARKLTFGAACVAAVLVIFSISQDWLDLSSMRQGAGSLWTGQQRKAAAAAPAAGNKTAPGTKEHPLGSNRGWWAKTTGGVVGASNDDDGFLRSPLGAQAQQQQQQQQQQQEEQQPCDVHITGAGGLAQDFALQGNAFQDMPLYRSARSGMWLFYLQENSSWNVGSALGSAKGAVYRAVGVGAQTPDLVTAAWSAKLVKAGAAAGWQSDARASVSCVLAPARTVSPMPAPTPVPTPAPTGGEDACSAALAKLCPGEGGTGGLRGKACGVCAMSNKMGLFVAGCTVARVTVLCGGGGRGTAATAATTANTAATAAAAIAATGRARLNANAATKVVAPATARDESTADPATLVALDAAEAAKHPPHTVLVMSDSRPLAAAAAGGYLSLAYLLNRAYARRHGYHLHFVQTACVDPADDIKSCACCAHATMGPRSSPWCKLVSVNRTMHAFPSAQRVVYLDSDAFVWAQGVKLETMVFKHFGARVLGLPNNLPWTMPPANSGIQFWRNTPGGRRLLQQWWDWPVTPWSNRHHEFEQAVLHEGFLKVHAREIVVFGHMKVMAPGPLPPPRKQFIAHVCGAWAAKRIPIMDAALCVIEHRRFTTFPGGCLHMPPSVPPPPVGRCPCALVTKPVAGWLSLN